MESIIIRFSLLASIIYVLVAFFKGAVVEDYLINAIGLFIVVSLFFLTINYIILKIFLSAKVELLEDEMVKRYKALEEFHKKQEEKRIAEEEKKRQEFEERERQRNLKAGKGNYENYDDEDEEEYELPDIDTGAPKTSVNL